LTQSANGEIDQTLGLARNVPTRISTVTLFLQMHIIRGPAYDILLGRPFDILTESTVKNFANEDQTSTIRDFKKGDLVLMRNTQIKKSLNRKMRPRYLELDGTAFHRPVATFRIIQYFARSSLDLPANFIDIDTARLREIEEEEEEEEDGEEEDPPIDDDEADDED
jgi:hypothetical protein